MISSNKTSKKAVSRDQKKLILVHGWEGSSDRDWIPWLKSEMENKDWDVVAPNLPNTREPKVHEWIPALIQITGEVDDNTFMVGHSLGCIATIRFLENLAGDKSIGGAILVAGFDNPLGVKELENFFEGPIHWEKVKRTCKKFVVIHSADDPIVPADNGIRMKNNLEAKKILVNGYKHFSGGDGVVSLPLVLQELLEISS